jgi:acetate kinase
MAEKILTLNLGSSSLKFALFDRETMHREMGETIEGVDTPALQAIEQKVAEHGGAISAIAHRVVHGGWLYQDHARITLEMLEKLKGLEALAPNHLPLEIRFMAASLEHFVDIPQIACFDTVFHRDLPVAARTLALPRRLQQAGVRRYGFHGLSYTYLMRTLPEYIGERANGRIILAHLGSGASLAAVKKGVAIDTTMGMTPLGGLVMATRCGDIDPGVPLFLAKTQGLSQEGFEHMAYAESGLLGLSETSGDVRDLLKSEAHDSRAAEALSIFCYQTRKWIAAMAAALEGVDVIIRCKSASVSAKIWSGWG